MENKEKDKYADLPHRQGIIRSLDEGVFGEAGPISIVFEGAIEQEFKMYAPNKFIYAKIDDEKRIITGPAMRAGYKILQQDMWTGEYYTVSYDAEQIRNFMKLFSRDGHNRYSNLQHSQIAGNDNFGYSFEQWQVIDPNNDKSNALGFQEVNAGDMYVSYFIENVEMWNFIKQNGFKGFSIEALISEKLVQNSNIEREKDIEDKIKEIALSEDFTEAYKEREIAKLLGISVNEK